MIKAVQSLKHRGKIRLSHAPVNTIRKLIELDVHEYVNLHYHWCGSYTSSGEGQYDGNLEKVKLSAQKEMGVFIISAFNNGGWLYAPSKKLRSLTLPNLEPISYGALWCYGIMNAAVRIVLLFIRSYAVLQGQVTWTSQ